MLAIIDYGIGNLFSLKSSFAAIGVETCVTNDIREIERANRLILPGVGAFRDAAAKLQTTGMAEVVCREAAKGKPIMGICLGMQLLFEKSLEYGEHQGLGLLKGTVRPIEEVVPNDLKIPHMGWNALDFTETKHTLFRYIQPKDCVYFVHSYYAVADEACVIATAEYGAPLTAAVAKGNVMGCQFHPEKSGNVGLNILRAFCEMGGEPLC